MTLQICYIFVDKRVEKALNIANVTSPEQFMRQMLVIDSYEIRGDTETIRPPQWVKELP